MSEADKNVRANTSDKYDDLGIETNDEVQDIVTNDVIANDTEVDAEEVQVDTTDIAVELEGNKNEQVSKKPHSPRYLTDEFLPILIISFVFAAVLAISVKVLIDKDEQRGNNLIEVSNSVTTIADNIVSVTVDTTAPIPEITEPIVVTEPSLSYYVSNRMNWEKGVVGEISIPATFVEDKVAQAEDNTYYLTKDIDGVDDASGYLFLDYRNSKREFDRNNIIYGHNMKDGTRFGTLTRLLSDDYYIYSNPSNVIYYNTLEYTNRFVIYSVYEVDLTTFNYIQTGFADDTEFAEYLAISKGLNEVSYLTDCQDDVNVQSKILTLSTCTQGGTHRLVVQAYLADSKPAD